MDLRHYFGATSSSRDTSEDLQSDSSEEVLAPTSKKQCLSSNSSQPEIQNCTILR